MYIFLLKTQLKKHSLYIIEVKGSGLVPNLAQLAEHSTVVVKTNIGRSLVRFQQFGRIIVPIVNNNQLIIGYYLS